MWSSQSPEGGDYLVLNSWPNKNGKSTASNVMDWNHEEDLKSRKDLGYGSL